MSKSGQKRIDSLLSQTITPEERQRRLELARLLSDKYRSEAANFRNEGGALELGFAVERDAFSITIDFLLSELDRVKREDRVTGWDEGFKAGRVYGNAHISFKRKMRAEADADPLSTPGDSGIRPPRLPLNPHRNAA